MPFICGTLIQSLLFSKDTLLSGSVTSHYYASDKFLDVSKSPCPRNRSGIYILRRSIDLIQTREFSYTSTSLDISE
jgi:hypothetical protein